MQQQLDARTREAFHLPNPDQLIDTAELARMACLSETYARQLRVIGGGPRFIKLTSKTVRYRVGDVLDWIDSRPSMTSTSEAA